MIQVMILNQELTQHMCFGDVEYFFCYYYYFSSSL